MKHIGIGAQDEQPKITGKQRAAPRRRLQCWEYCDADCDCMMCECYPQPSKPLSPALQSVLYKL